MTNTQNKNGRKPLPTKPSAGAANPFSGYFSQDILQLEASIKAELDAKGYECRWIDAKEFTDSGNMHRNYWKPYRRDKRPDNAAANQSDILDSDWKFGSDPEGFIRRKGLVLAVRPKQLGDDHRFSLAEKSQRLHGGLKRRQAEGLVERARAAGVNVSVDDGDDN